MISTYAFSSLLKICMSLSNKTLTVCIETLRYRSVPQNHHDTLLKEYMRMQPVWHENISNVRNIFQDHAKERDLCKRPNSFQIETDLDDVPVEANKLIACLTGHQF